MQLGMIGLGRIGASMVRRLQKRGRARILRSAKVGQRDVQPQSEHDAETTPLRDPESYRFEMNLPEITEVWRRGSVIGSWSLDLTVTALLKDAELAGYGGHLEKPAS